MLQVTLNKAGGCRWVIVAMRFLPALALRLMTFADARRSRNDLLAVKGGQL
jgi:hypothetical protein